MKLKTSANKISAYVLPRLGEILFAAVFAAVIGLGPRLMNMDGDLGRHLTLGRYILEGGGIPTRDIFSFTKLGDPLTPHEWLADVIFALANKAVGLDGVVWLTALVLAGSLWLVYKHSLELSNMSLSALAGGMLAAAAGSVHWLTRPHIFTLLFAALWTMELDRLRLGLRKSWLIFPLLMLVWVNLHGAFLAGIVIWAAFTAGMLMERQHQSGPLRAMIAVGPLCLLVTLLNPDGIGIWRTGFGFLGSKYLVSHTAEYLPPDFQNPAFWPFLLIIAGSIYLLGRTRNRLHPSYALLVAGWSAMALYSARNIPIFLVVAVPILCAQASCLVKEQQQSRIAGWILRLQDRINFTEGQIRGGVLSAVVVLGSLVLLLQGHALDFERAGNVFDPSVFPEAAVNWMEDHPQQGNGFNYFTWGGYLLYRTWPDQLVFIDGQTDFYGEGLTREYENVITLQPGWPAVLEKYQVAWVLMPEDSQLTLQLAQDPGWTVLYQDETAALFKRSDAE